MIFEMGTDIVKKLAEHEAWIRKGIKARRTRNEGKVRRLEEMRKIHGQRITQQGKIMSAIIYYSWATYGHARTAL